MSGGPRPQLLIDAVLGASTVGRALAVVDVESTVNLRWADNSLTTNGATTSTTVTVVALFDTRGGPATGVASATIGDADEIAALVGQAEQSARDAEPAPDAQPLLEVSNCCDADWNAPTTAPSITSLIAGSRLADVLAAAAAERIGLYGYAEHRMSSTWVGSGSGLRLRVDSPEGHVSMTARRTGSDGTPRTSWVGRAFADPAVLDPEALYAELRRRLGWGARRIELPAGRHDTVLPPEAVADLVGVLYSSLGARAALDGHSVWSGTDTGPGPASAAQEPGPGRTRIGHRVADRRVRLYSDPTGGAFPELRCPDRVLARASSADRSVLDTGLALAATDWIRDGVARALVTSRASAAGSGLAVTPSIGNVLLCVDDRDATTDELVAGVDRGLLLTSLWYLREVDPRTLLVTGLTRDGVYRVEGGEVVGEVNNFRFNESPLSVLNRFSAAGTTVPALSREWGDQLPRMAMPPLRVPDFRMTSASEAR